MANFPTRANWHTQIRRIESGDSVIGGENAPINLCLGGLAERTDWLKTEIARAVSLIGTNQNTASQQFALKTTQINAGAGLTGGGVLRDNTTISMGTPSKITATSQNSAISNTHSHEIDKASTSIAGIVRLSSATDSTAENLAATPKAVKQLADLIGATGSASFPQRGALGSRNLNDLKGTENYGVWHQAGSAGATTALNYPVQVAGTLFVVPSAYAGVQLYIPFNGREIHIRHSENNNGNWSAWRTTGYTAASTNAVGIVQLSSATDSTDENFAATPKAVKTAFDRASLITVSGAQDANQIALTGVPAAVCNVNTPKAGHWYVLNVSYNNKGGNVGQIAWQYLQDRPQEVWTRAKYNNTWGSWTRIDGTDWASVREKPNTFAGYGLTGSKTYDGVITLTAGNYPSLILSPANSQNNWHWEAHGNKSYFIHRSRTNGDNIKIINLPESSGTLALKESIVDLKSDQTINATKTFFYQIKLANGDNNARFGVNQRDTFIHNQTSNKFLQLDNDGTLKYNDAKVFHESNRPTWAQVAAKPSTLSGYGITDGVTPTQLQAAIAGIVSSSPAALDTLRELAAALGNDPNYATTTARKLGEAAPSGTVAWFAGSSAPAGWLKANGAAISRTTYAALFAAIGTTYGAGDGRTTFNLPDLRGEFVRGWDDGRQVDSARVLGSRQSDALQQHSHELPNDTDLLTASRGGAIGHGGANTRSTHTRPLGNVTGARTAAETRPRNIALLGIIKI